MHYRDTAFRKEGIEGVTMTAKDKTRCDLQTANNYMTQMDIELVHKIYNCPFSSEYPQFPPQYPKYPAENPQYPAKYPQYSADYPRYPADYPRYPADYPRYPADY